jgi:hypothetical protein
MIADNNGSNGAASGVLLRGLEMTARRPTLIYPENDLETAVESYRVPANGYSGIGFTGSARNRPYW